MQRLTHPRTIKLWETNFIKVEVSKIGDVYMQSQDNQKPLDIIGVLMEHIPDNVLLEPIEYILPIIVGNVICAMPCNNLQSAALLACLIHSLHN